MTVKPSSIAVLAAAKRAKARNRAGGKRAPLNLMDTLKAMDREASRSDKLERKIQQLEAKVNWLEHVIRKSK